MAFYLKLLVTCVLALTMSANAADKKIPKQMRQLYKQYKQQGVQEGDVNTIRYIAAHRGSITSSSNLLFALDSLHKYNDTLIKAELHFYRRSTEEMKLIQIDVSEVSPYYISLVQRRRLNPTGKGWQQMDITTAVKRCTNTINSNNQLGLGFSNVNADMVAVSVNIPQFLRHHGLPFILIYSNNTRTLEMDQIADKTKLGPEEMVKELDSMIDPKNGRLIGDQGQKYERRRRSVTDNKIDVVDTIEDKPGIHTDDLYNELTNNIEKPKANIESGVKQITTASEDIEGHQAIEEVQYIPWPTKRNKKSNYKRKHELLLPKSGFQTIRQQSKGCDRKSLRINFEDIGWSDRVIEPKKFDAYYCAGECKFPYSYGKQLTNHATLQSLITSIHSKSDVPQPCCVPQKLQPVTLMFYDEYKNIVLKTYPDMTVESCMCR